MKKEIGVIGLGKMGANVARHLKEQGWRVIGHATTPISSRKLEGEGIKGAATLKELVEQLSSPRIIWLMMPAGQGVDTALFGKGNLTTLLKKGDIVVDSGNSFYKDSIRRAKILSKKGIYFIDVGYSGGPYGARNGGSLMIGGERKTFKKLEPLFRALACKGGYQFFPGAGAGHFVKMVHNGIEYGMMQALGEGFAILRKSKYKLDLKNVVDIYNHGSVIESRLVGWLEAAFKAHTDALTDVSGSVAHTGEGLWTVQTAKEMGIAAKVIEDAFKFRINSHKHPDYTGKVVSALREQFGGHLVTDKSKRK